MGIYAYRGERGVTIEVSSRLLQSLTRKEKEKLRCFAASILAFVGIACQLASILGFVVVLLLTGVANVALVPQAERVGKGGDSPNEGKESSGEKELGSRGKQHEIEEDEHREERQPNTKTKKQQNRRNQQNPSHQEATTHKKHQRTRNRRGSRRDGEPGETKRNRRQSRETSRSMKRQAQLASPAPRKKRQRPPRKSLPSEPCLLRKRNSQARPRTIHPRRDTGERWTITFSPFSARCQVSREPHVSGERRYRSS